VPMTLIVGRANSGKTGVLYRLLREAESCGDAPVLLLPSAPDVKRARAELVLNDGVVRARIEQLDRYLASLWNLYGDGRRLVNNAQRSTLLSREVRQLVGRAGEDGRTRGLVRVTGRLVQHMSTAPVAPVAGEGCAYDIVTVLGGYWSLLEELRLVEPAAAYAILAQRVVPSWFGGPLFVNRVDDLTESQERFLEAAARGGAHVHIAATMPRETSGTDASGSLAARLRGAADNVVEAAEIHATTPELDQLERHLFSPGSRIEPSGAVRLSEAYGEEAEAERITREIQDMAETGIPFDHIAVLFRDAREHEAALARSLEEAGIPADFDTRVAFSTTSFGRSLMCLIGFITEAAPAQLLWFIKSEYSGIDRETVDALDASWKRLGGCAAATLLQDTVRRAPRAKALLEETAILGGRVLDSETAIQWKRLAARLLSNAHGSHAPLLDADLSDDAAAHRLFCRVVDDATGAAGGEESSAEQLAGMLASSLVSPTVFERPGHVQVMDAVRARGRRFDGVIIGGLVAGDFPRHDREDALSVSATADVLRRAGVKVSPPDRHSAERTLFYLAVTRARKRLVLSRQAADSDGKLLRPSPLLEELLDAYRDEQGCVDPDLPRSALTFADLASHPAAPASTRRAARAVALAGAVGGAEGTLDRSAYRTRGIRDSSVLDELRGRTVFSATELESYLRCPYSWFYERFVRPDALAEENDALASGALAHHALQSVFTHMRDVHGLTKVTESTFPLWDRAARDAVQDVCAGQPRSRLRQTLVAREVASMVTALIKRDLSYLPGFKTTHTEWAFGLEDEPEDFGAFALTGVIDRVDRRDEALVVIDYKRRATIPKARFERVGALQAPLYAEVARRRLGGRIAGSLYRGLLVRRRTDLNRGFFDPAFVSGSELVSTDATDDVAEIVDSAISRAEHAAEGIRTGRIAPEPIGSESCAYCRAARWCGRAEG